MRIKFLQYYFFCLSNNSEIKENYKAVLRISCESLKALNLLSFACQSFSGIFEEAKRHKNMQVNTLDYNNWADKYADYLFSFAYYKVGKKEEAEDLVQETFLAAYKGRDSYNGTASEKTWLVSILKNKIIDFYRKPKITESFSSYLDKTEDSFESSFFDQDNYGRWKEDIGENYFSKAADSYLISKEFQHFLGVCLEKMPAKLKAVFVSKYIEDEKTENICKEHDITPSNYWVIIFRSKTILRTCLEKKGVMN